MLGSFTVFLCDLPCSQIPLIKSCFFLMLVNSQTNTFVCLVLPLLIGKEKQDASKGNGDAVEQGVPLRISQKYCPTDNAQNLSFLRPLILSLSRLCLQPCSICTTKWSFKNTESVLVARRKSFTALPDQPPLLKVFPFLSLS